MRKPSLTGRGDRLSVEEMVFFNEKIKAREALGLSETNKGPAKAAKGDRPLVSPNQLAISVPNSGY